MARTLAKLAFAPSGRIVYRANGHVVRAKTFSTKTDSRGVIRVYKDGRLYGVIGKPTKTQSEKISKLDRNRVRRAERKAVKDVVSASNPTSLSEAGGWRNSELEKEIYAHYPKGQEPVFLTRAQKEGMNLGAALSNAVKDGRLTVDEANEMWDRWEEAQSDIDRSKIWEEVHSKFEEEGYKYLEEGRSLVVDVLGIRDDAINTRLYR